MPLTPKLIETLVVLVERHGHIVDKQELLERVWPDTFVEEANVTRHVSLLRKTLSEWADTTELIETLPRRGYRFVAPVRQLRAAVVSETALTAPVAEHVTLPASPLTNLNEELIVETHTITRITAEEETADVSLPPTPALLALPAGTRPWWRARRIWVIGAIALVVSLAGLWVFLSRRNAALTEKDTLLLAEFVNRTGDPVFDGTLRQGLAVQLEQSPFLNFLAEQRVRETLGRMARSSEERLTVEIGREICLRQGLKALILGEIAPFGNHYVITLEAIAGQGGETLARAQSEAAAKEQVIQALSQAASSLREKLGESLSSLQKFDALLEHTTASLPALKSFTLGIALHRQGKHQEAIPFLQRAVELDPNFASAWAYLGAMYINTQQLTQASLSAARAYELRDRVSELERFRILVWYHTFTTHDLEKSIEVLEEFRHTYPRAPVAHNSLARSYVSLGRFDLAEAPARETMRLNPGASVSQSNLAETLLHLNQLAESRSLLTRMMEAGTATIQTRELLYLLACLAGDEQAQQHTIEQLKGTPDEYHTWKWQAQLAAFRGQVQQMQSALSQASQLAARPQLRGELSTLLAEAALKGTVLCASGVERPACDVSGLVKQALALERNVVVVSHSGLALALNGKLAEAEALEAEIQQAYSQDTLLNAIWRPLLHAVQALHQGQPAQAIEQLRLAGRYEAAARFYPQYLRGLAWLQLKSGPEAAAEFEKIRAQRYVDPLSPLYPLAHLGLARAAALQGDTTKSRQMYQEFFRLWKDAEANLPVMREAKAEFAKLH